MSIKRGKPQITIDTTSLQTNTQFLPTPNSSSIPQETVLRSSNLDDMIEYALSSKRVTKSELIRQAQMIPATTTHHQASINTQIFDLPSSNNNNQRTGYPLISNQGAVIISGSRKAKVKRKTKNHKTVELLEKAYKARPHWTRDDINGLQKITGLTRQQIYKWNWDEKRRNSQASSHPRKQLDSSATVQASSSEQKLKTQTQESQDVTYSHSSSNDASSSGQFQEAYPKNKADPSSPSSKLYTQSTQKQQARNYFHYHKNSAPNPHEFIPQSKFTNTLDNQLKKNLKSRRQSAFHPTITQKFDNQTSLYNSLILQPSKTSKPITYICQLKSPISAQKTMTVSPYLNSSSNFVHHKNNKGFKPIISNLQTKRDKTQAKQMYNEPRETKISRLQRKFDRFQLDNRNQKVFAKPQRLTPIRMDGHHILGWNKRNYKRKSQDFKSSFQNNNNFGYQSKVVQQNQQKRYIEQHNLPERTMIPLTTQDIQHQQSKLLKQRTFSQTNLIQEEIKSNPQTIYQRHQDQQEQDNHNIQGFLNEKQRSRSLGQMNSLQSENYLDHFLLQNQSVLRESLQNSLIIKDAKSNIELVNGDYQSSLGGNSAFQILPKSGKLPAIMGRFESTSSQDGFSLQFLNKSRFKTNSNNGVIESQDRGSSGSSWKYALAMRSAGVRALQEVKDDERKSQEGCNLPEKLSAQAALFINGAYTEQLRQHIDFQCKSGKKMSFVRK